MKDNKDKDIVKTSDGESLKKHKFKMPSAYVIVFFMLFLVCIMTFFIPVSVFDSDSGKIVFNAMLDSNGDIIKNVGPQAKGIWDLVTAPIKGFQDGAPVGIAILIAGGFLAVLNESQSLAAGINQVLKRLHGNALVAVMMFVCALLGTVFGFWEEITAFSLVVIPMFVMAGYDVMTGYGILFIGATVGNMASVVNPFSTGAAVAAISNDALSLGSGIVLRMILFVALYIVGTIMMIQYASGVKKNKEKSVLYGNDDIKKIELDMDNQPQITRRRFWSLVVFVVMIIMMLIGYTPWEAIGGSKLGAIINTPIILLEKIPVLGDIIGAANITPLGEWGFDEFSFLFLFGALLLIPINKMKVDRFTDVFLKGASDLLGVVIILSIARGIAVIMGDSSYGMSVTFIYWISNGLAGVPLWIFAIIATIAYMGIGVFLQSTSGVSGLSMPILGAVAAGLFTASAIGAVGGQIILISAFTIGLNFTNAIYPGATVMGTLELYNVPYVTYFKYALKFSIPLLLVGGIIISIAPYLGIVF